MNSVTQTNSCSRILTGRAAAYQELTKPGITRLVVLTAAAGFLMGAAESVDLFLLLHTLLGVALVASGTNALNQWWERDTDARMLRTRRRPLPSGALTPREALIFATVLSAVGVVYLALTVNLLTAGLAFVTVTSYVLLYTPLKRRTAFNTLIGAVPGALPILGGWTAAGGELNTIALSLFWVLFLWQLPHFLALAWMYREDYARAGIIMLSGSDDDGRVTGRQAALYAAALLPVSLVPAVLGVSSAFYFTVSAVLGIGFLVCGVIMALRHGEVHARRLFLASIAYLPLLLGAMVVDKLLLV